MISTAVIPTVAGSTERAKAPIAARVTSTVLAVILAGVTEMARLPRRVAGVMVAAMMAGSTDTARFPSSVAGVVVGLSYMAALGVPAHPDSAGVVGLESTPHIGG